MSRRIGRLCRPTLAACKAEAEATDEAAYQEQAADLLALPDSPDEPDELGVAGAQCEACSGKGQVCVRCGRPEPQCDCEELLAGEDRVRAYDPITCEACGGSRGGSGSAA
jgi:hypothetical protein